jgi:uncharacterized protein (TIGR01777 family)
MQAVITGATGLVGKQLVRRLENPVVLTRDPAKAERAFGDRSVRAHRWDAEAEAAPAEAFDGAEVVFHLAGEPVAEGRWTAAKKARIRDSRVVGTRHLVETLVKLPQPPRVLVSCSAVGFYGSRGEEVLTESASPGSDFLAEVCIGWEREAQQATERGIRVANPRVGIVLAKEGGALPRMLTPFRLGVGSPLGNGRQYMPWIHIADMVGLLLFCAEHESLAGPVNATAPNPVTNREFTKTLARAVHRPAILPPVPGFVLRAMLGEFGEVLLGSQRAVPRAALDAGYRFEYSELGPALENLV